MGYDPIGIEDGNLDQRIKEKADLSHEKKGPVFYAGKPCQCDGCKRAVENSNNE